MKNRPDRRRKIWHNVLSGGGGWGGGSGAELLKGALGEGGLGGIFEFPVAF